jgi:hypothetical protein
MTRLLTAALALSLAASPSPAAEKKAAAKASHFQGKVVALAELLKKKDVKLDADAAPATLALEADDGKVYPLVKNDGSRMFFKDKALLNRPMRLTATLVAGGLLDVSAAHSVVKGKLHEVYYWCDNCALAYSEPGECICCGAAVKLVEVAVTTPPEKIERLLPR